MKSEQLEELKKISTENYNNLKNKIKELEESKEVKEYLENINKLQNSKKYKEFLNFLDIGEDGTIFEPYNETTDKYHYGLIEVLRHIEYLKYLNYQKLNNENITLEEYNKKYNDNTEISLKQINQYIENATKILNNMRYYEQDRRVKNDYKLEIYENPKKYSIINFKEVLELFSIKKYILQILISEKTNQSYKNNEFIISKKENNYTFRIKKENNIKPIYTHKLTSREFEAFYGTDAQNTLSLVPIELNKQERLQNIEYILPEKENEQNKNSLEKCIYVKRKY